MSIDNAIASVAVRDLNTAIRWYEKLLRKSPTRPMPEVAEWSFERGGWLQVYQLPERAGSGSFTLAVSNLEEEAARLTNLNIDTSQRTSSARVKTLMITDPDGNHIALAEAADRSMAR
ncbi:MAG TPA: VOC family protein [Burkholderiaceae bacterium]|nr:VOC family protein [Burkholderiaceae bacterium]